MKTLKSLCGALTITCGLVVTGHCQSFLTNGLVAYYPFNGNANDASGNGRNGTVVGATLVADRFGNPASAYSFASQSDSITVYNSLHPQGEVTVTYSCWVKESETSVNDTVHMAIINCGFGGIVNARSELGTVRPLPIGSPSYLTYTGEGNDGGTSNNIVTTDSWHQLVITKYQTNLVFYMDGSAVGSGTTQPGQNVTSQQLNIGWNGTTTWHSGEHFYGVLDDVRIYNRALSASEVQQLYQYESTPPPSFLTNGLVAYYPFNGNANDASGNGNNGTAANVTFTQVSNRLAATFTGALNSSVTVSNSPSLDMTNAVTISLWFNSFGNNSGPAGFLDKAWKQPVYHDWSYRSWFLFWSTGAGGIVNFQANGPALATGAGVSQLNDNQWYHMVFIADGEHGLLQVYTNGVFGAGSTYAPFTLSTGPFPLVIGSMVAQTDGAQTGLYGAINDVRIYNRALSAAEVQQLYAYESEGGPQVSLIKAVKPAFSNLLPGTSYQLQVSTDLTTWTNTGSVFTATNSSMVYPQYFDVDNWGELFFRLQLTP